MNEANTKERRRAIIKIFIPRMIGVEAK